MTSTPEETTTATTEPEQTVEPEKTPGHEETPVDRTVSGPPVDEGNAQSVGEVPNNVEEEPKFPLAHVQKLREESANHRLKGQRADDLGQRLHTASRGA